MGLPVAVRARIRACILSAQKALREADRAVLEGSALGAKGYLEEARRQVALAESLLGRPGA